MTANATSPSAPRTAKAKTPCECSHFEILTNLRESAPGKDLVWDEEITTGCPGTLTGRTFAPGHDAKLKGYLIRAGLEGHEVRYVGGGMVVSSDAITMAEKYGFGQMVRSGIAGGMLKREIRLMKKGDAGAIARGNKAQAKVDAITHDGNEARQAREAKSLAERVAAEEAAHAAEVAAARPEPEWDDEAAPEVVTAKVGRWEYEGTIEGDEFTYTNKAGAATTTTKFTRV